MSRVFKKSHASSSSVFSSEQNKPFFNSTAIVRDTDTGGQMTRHLTSSNDVDNLSKEVSSPTRSTDFFGGKDTFFR